MDVQGQGVPSDHDGVLAVPITTSDSQRVAQSRKVKVRPLPDTLMRQFGNIIVDQSWSFLAPYMLSTQMVAAFEKHSSSLIENIFPEKTVTISEWDKPYMTEELKLLRRKRQRTYRKGGRSAKYLNLKHKFDKKLKVEAEKYRQKIISEVQEGKRSNSYAALRKLETGNNVGKKSNFTLPSHAEEELTPAQSAERLAEYFSLISQEFEPICVENFPPSIKAKLDKGKNDVAKPVLEDWQVFAKFNKSKSQIP